MYGKSIKRQILACLVALSLGLSVNQTYAEELWDILTPYGTNTVQGGLCLTTDVHVVAQALGNNTRAREFHLCGHTLTLESDTFSIRMNCLFGDPPGFHGHYQTSELKIGGVITVNNAHLGFDYCKISLRENCSHLKIINNSSLSTYNKSIHIWERVVLNLPYDWSDTDEEATVYFKGNPFPIENNARIVPTPDDYPLASGRYPVQYFLYDRILSYTRHLPSGVQFTSDKVEYKDLAGDANGCLVVVGYDKFKWHIAPCEGTCPVDIASGTRAVESVNNILPFAHSANGWGTDSADVATITYTLNGGAPQTLGTYADGDTATWTPTENGTYVFTHSPGDFTATFTVYPSVELLKAAQRYPWNNIVDYTYSLANCNASKTYKLAVGLTVGGVTKVSTNELTTVADGIYTGTVDAATLFPNAFDKAGKIKLQLIEAK